MPPKRSLQLRVLRPRGPRLVDYTRNSRKNSHSDADACIARSTMSISALSFNCEEIGNAGWVATVAILELCHVSAFTRDSGRIRAPGCARASAPSRSGGCDDRAGHRCKPLVAVTAGCHEYPRLASVPQIQPHASLFTDTKGPQLLVLHWNDVDVPKMPIKSPRVYGCRGDSSHRAECRRF